MSVLEHVVRYYEPYAFRKLQNKPVVFVLAHKKLKVG